MVLLVSLPEVYIESRVRCDCRQLPSRSRLGPFGFAQRRFATTPVPTQPWRVTARPSLHEQTCHIALGGIQPLLDTHIRFASVDLDPYSFGEIK
jgi:hypothetical protein